MVEEKANLLYNNKVYIGHVGDSRVYRIRNEIIRKITTDHSYVEKLIKEGYEDFDKEYPFSCKGTDIYIKLFDILDSYISEEEVSDIRQMQLNENITRICFFSLSRFDMPAI